MANQIINTVASVIKAEYGDYDIYTESVEQGFKKPCFFIKQIDSSMEKISIGRYQKDVHLDVHFFNHQNTSLRDVGDKFFDLMECIEFEDGSLLGKRMRYEIVDAVLHFFVTFKPIFKNQAQEVDNMEQIDIEVK